MKISKARIALAALFVVPLVALEIVHDVRSGEGEGKIPKSEVESAHLWSAVHRCWLGEPLARGEAIEARIASLLHARPAKPGPNDWPMRCAPLAEKFEKALQAAPEHSMQGTSYAVSMLASRFESGTIDFTNASTFTLPWFDRASRLAPAVAVEPPPRPPKPIIAFGEGVVTTDEFISAKVIGADGRFRFVQGPRVCTADNDGARIHRRPLPDALPRGTYASIYAGGSTALVGQPAEPTSKEAFREVVVEEESGRVAWTGPDGAWDAMLRDGVYYGIGKGLSLIVTDGSGKTTKTPLPPEVIKVAFLDDRVIGIGGTRVVAISLGKDAPIELGARPSHGGNHPSAYCKTEQASFVMLPGVLIRHDGATWQAQRGSEKSFIGCSGDKARWVDVNDAEMERVDCGPTECVSSKAPLTKLGHEEGRAAIACDDSVIFVESAAGALSYAVAPIASAAAAPKKLLRETMPAQRTSVAPDFMAVPVKGGGLFLFRTTEGIAGARIGCDGTAAAVVVD